VKTATASGSSIAYRFAVTNTGNVTITDVSIAEGRFTGTGHFPAIDCPDGAGSLAPGEAIVCTATYALTDADLQAGQVRNTAVAQGDGPGGRIASPPSTAVAALDALASTGLRVDQTIWFGAALLVIGGAAIGFGYARRRRS
jgi:hypothetical protein